MHPTNTIPTAGTGSAGGSRRRPPARRAASALAALAAVAGAAVSFTAAPALADDCPNAVLRAQNNSTQLPECRAYEQVTPVFKEAFPPSPNGFTDDGRLAFESNGNFADNGNGFGAIPGGNQYVGVRTGSGWSTKALSPPGPEFYTDDRIGGLSRGLSSDLSSTLWTMRRGDEPDDVADVYVRRDDVFTRIGPMGGSTPMQTSDDLSHLVFLGAHGGVLEYDGDGSGQPRMVSVDNAGQPLPAPGCPSLIGGQAASTYHAVSADGRVIFWTPDPHGCGATNVVYARVNGATTIDASASQCTRGSSDPGGVCNPEAAAEFQGANADGTRVYFTTSQQLVNADTDTTPDLYECDIPAGTPAPVGAVNPCPDLREVSGAAAGADVQGVTRISDDGSRVYFVAAGVLAANTDANDAPAVAGDANLYVWQRDAAHPDGATRFVAKLLAPQPGGDQGDPGNTGVTGGLWGTDYLGRFVQTTDDGRYLVFATRAQVIDHGPQADTDTAKDIYRYDAETGTMTRLSVDADGQGGNEPGQNAQITPIAYDTVTFPIRRTPRVAMSDDGGSVVFTTSDALAPSDTNGTADTYLWHEGRVSLISTGKPSLDAQIPDVDGALFGTTTRILGVISPSGRDVFFATTAPLIPSDVDTVLDIYDARVDGGFAPTPTPTPCAGDACQGGRSAPPPHATPGSTSSKGQGDSPQTTPVFTVGNLTTSQLKRVVSTGKVVLSITTNAPGRLSAQATSTIAKRSSTIGSAKRIVAKAGTVALSLMLSKRARAELKSTRKLTVKVLIRQDNVAIARTVSLKLTQPKPAKQKAKKTSSRTTRHAAITGGRS
jgi:hypothetical protein